MAIIQKFAISVVNALPTSNISTTTIYLVTTGSESQNLYTEYIYVDDKWEKLGTQTIDLSGYAKTSDLTDLNAKKHEHSNKDVLDGITSSKVSAWDAKAKILLDGETLIFQ